MNYLMNGLAALAFIVLFSQCAGKTDNQTTNAPAQANAELSGMKIAYVEIDTLLAKYNFCIDLNEAMVKKSENVRMTLNQKATSLNKEKQDFQKKVENNAFLSQDRAQQEYNRLVKLEQDLQELSNKLQNGLMEENNKNSLQFRDSINAFLKEYNKTHGYSLIFSNTAFKKMQKQDGDINMLISPSSLLSAYANPLNYGISHNIDLKDLKMLGSLSFEKGKIELKVESYTENTELKALFEKQIKSTCPIENTFLKYFPKSTLALFSIGINGEELYNVLPEHVFDQIGRANI